jgi:hypothetical protein
MSGTVPSVTNATTEMKIECDACGWLVNIRGYDEYPHICPDCGAWTEWVHELEPIAPEDRKSGSV